jgi:hypothetical protein
MTTISVIVGSTRQSRFSEKPGPVGQPFYPAVFVAREDLAAGLARDIELQAPEKVVRAP